MGTPGADLRDNSWQVRQRPRQRRDRRAARASSASMPANDQLTNDEMRALISTTSTTCAERPGERGLPAPGGGPRARPGALAAAAALARLRLADLAASARDRALREQCSPVPRRRRARASGAARARAAGRPPRSSCPRAGDAGLVFQRIAYGYGTMPGFAHKLERGDLEMLTAVRVRPEHAALRREVSRWIRNASRTSTNGSSCSTTGSATACARAGGPSRATAEQIEDRSRPVDYTCELRELVRDLIVSSSRRRRRPSEA